jgi:hypothetical protein
MDNRPKFNVVFRTCDSVVSVHNTERPFDLDKRELIKVCFKSLIKSLDNIPHSITVIGDKLSSELVAFFESYNVEYISGNFGNDASIKASIEKALEFKDDEWVYLCEDDYLHRIETFQFISGLIRNKNEIISLPSKSSFFESGNTEIANADLVIFPTDYPDRYWAEDRKPSYIFISSDCHWRQVTNTTFTFICKASSIKKNKKMLLKSSKNANDGYLSRKWFGQNRFNKKALCLTPLPSLTCHLHKVTISPLIDWKIIVDTYRTF